MVNVPRSGKVPRSSKVPRSGNGSWVPGVCVYEAKFLTYC